MFISIYFAQYNIPSRRHSGFMYLLENPNSVQYSSVCFRSY